MEELAGTRFGDRAEVGDRLLARQADTVVRDGQRLRLGVEADTNLQFGKVL